MTKSTSSQAALSHHSLELALHRAMSLSERAKFKHEHISIDNNSDETVNAWLHQEPFATNPRWLNERLAVLGLEGKELNNLLQETEKSLQNRIGTAPEWLTSMLLFCQESDTELQLPEIKVARLRGDGFLKLVEPLIRAGYSRLCRAVDKMSAAAPGRQVNTDTVCQSLYQDLVVRLATVSGRTLVLELQVAKLLKQLEGDTPEQRFSSFAKSLSEDETRLKLFIEYPVLARLATELTLSWLEYSLEIIEHCLADWSELGELLPTAQDLSLEGIELGAGDPHKQGRSVAILSFSQQQKLVYKPRAVAVEARFADLLDWCNQQKVLPEFRVLKILDRGRYGWVEYAQYQECQSSQQAKHFFQRQGGLLALTYLLDANDFHFENIVASGDQPLLVDLETLFHPFLDNSDQSEDDAPAAGLKRTVLRTGLLPRRLWTGEGDSPGVDLSGMGEVSGQETPNPVLGVEASGTDEMHFCRKVVEMPGANNVPRLQGQALKASEYVDDICYGFGQIFESILEHKDELTSHAGPLMAFAETEVRVIARETRIYANFLMESVHPDYMRSALDRDLFFEQLWMATDNQKYLAKLVPFESQDMLAMDIPVFNAKPGERHLWTSTGDKIDNVLHQPPLDKVISRLKRLDAEESRRQQWIIRCALYSVTLAGRGPERSSFELLGSAQPAKATDLLSASESVAERISALAFVGKNDASWFSWKPIGNSHWDLEPMACAMYDGLCGVSFYLAYLGSINGDARTRELAEMSLTTARYLWQHYPQNLNGIGAFSGWASPIYLLMHLSQLWQRESLLTEAVELVEVLATHIEADEGQDIVSGAAGAIVVLLELYKLTSSQRVLDVAMACGRRLLSRAVSTKNGIAWVLDESGPTPLAGMSHGTAGIAWALSSLGKTSGEQEFSQAAQQALLYERSTFSEAQQNWPDLRHGERPENTTNEDGCFFLTAWCHGAPGIGLARLAMMDDWQDEQLLQEIETAIATTSEYGFSDNHSLCHGALGNLDLMLLASDKLNRPELGEKVNDVAGQILASHPQSGWITGLMYNLETPGLMVGLSGIGYQLLRIAHPDKVPSVLSLAGPC